MSKDETKLVGAARDPIKQSGYVNPGIYQGSTIVFPTLEDYHNAEKGEPYYEATKSGSTLDHAYGINGTPTVFALQKALCELERGAECVIVPSGLNAITTAITSFVAQGDHVLVIDNCYGPTRRFCHTTLKSFGVETDYYPPDVGENITDYIKDNTKVIFMETPGSQTFEMLDVPAIVKAAKERGIVTMLDNSWATPLYYKPIEQGVDISIQALTKYIGGHADIMLGAIICNEATADKVLKTYRYLGLSASPQDCYQTLRGLRTMAARLERHQASARVVIDWIKQQDCVSRVLYPGDKDDPGYEIWKRDFTGAGGLFSVIFKEHYAEKKVHDCVNKLEHFGIGASWGGYESLVLDFDVVRTASEFTPEGTCLRFYIGLEHPDDLIADIEAGLKRLTS